MSVPVGMISAHFFGDCYRESGMPIHKSDHHQTNNVEIASCFAPKPQLNISALGWTGNTPEVEYPFLQYIYGLYGAADQVENVHIPTEGHDYGISKRLTMYPFMARHLDLDLAAIQDENGDITGANVVLEEPSAFRVFDAGHPLPEYALRSNGDVPW